MTDTVEALERQIDDLRSAVRQAVMSGHRAQARALRADLRRAERAWDDALSDLDDRPQLGRDAGPLLPIRDQVHHALTLIGGPAAPKLVTAVHEAFYASEIVGARLTSLRRDEERSFRSAPYSRPYYLCPALAADLLTPARGLLAVSTWPLSRRIIGPLSTRVDFLTAAIHIAERVERAPSPDGERLLWRFAANIPDAGTMQPEAVARAARAELDVHQAADHAQREAAAERARTELDEAGQLFGSKLGIVPRAGTR